MHKHTAPRLFDLTQRSTRYTVGLGLISGFVLSILVHLALTLWSGDKHGADPRGNSDTIEMSTSKHRPATPSPESAVRY